MNQQDSEQEWHQLKGRINNFVGRFLQDDVPAIEHKSNVVALLQAPPEYVNMAKMEMTNDL
ncbi:MAG: hypothetical protein CVU71_16620 [Deltaproteobacteria bacterium HGW-Deltaproteobacteria-6]|jgi:hypothetical protein|nr:MAG: hypothetical protein CVU71_16620 [Deltaproteobacteria bacterium HGW-Deltaproteobacteria-6]